MMLTPWARLRPCRRCGCDPRARGWAELCESCRAAASYLEARRARKALRARIVRRMRKEPAQ